jgi:hypothetical protein
VRTLRVGRWFSLTQLTLDHLFTQAGQRCEFGVLSVEQVGIKNLPKLAQQSLSALLLASFNGAALKCDLHYLIGL